MERTDKILQPAINDEIKVIEFELQLWRVFYGFMRWQEECEKNVNALQLTGTELIILHAISMKNKPKAIHDIARLLNRNDLHNIRYSLSKLLKLDLIQKVKSARNSKNFFFQASEVGLKNIKRYAKIRKNILIKLFSQQPELSLEVISKNLVKINAIYEAADRLLASYTDIPEMGREEET
jgi:predicted MarR family transcription regulator